MAANGAADAIVSPRHAAAATVAEAPENEADGHDSQKKKSAFQITSVVVKTYSEDDNQRHPRSMDELDLDGDRNDGSVYSTEPGYESYDNGMPPLPHDQSSAGAALYHHPAALSSTAVIRSFSHALSHVDPKGSRFVVVKVESKDPYGRGRWKCMDYQDESDKGGDTSIVVKSADSSGSSRASSVNYQHGVDDPVRNPLLGLLHNIPEGGAPPPPSVAAAAVGAPGKLPVVTEQQQQQLQASPAGGAAVVLDGGGGTQQQHHHHHHGAAASGSANPDVMLKTAFTGYPPGAVVPPAAAAASLLAAAAAAAAAGQAAHTVASLSHSNLPGGQPKPAASAAATATAAATAGPALFSSAIPNARTPVEGLSSLATGAGTQPLHDLYPATAAAIAAAAAASVPAVDAELVVPDGRPSPSLPAGLSHPALQQQLVQQPKNAIVIVKPEPVRSMPVSAHLAMTLGETLGLQVRDEPSASDTQIRDTDAAATGVAIDNKIEQAMDLVKSHLMFAVREEVEDLRQQIKELVDEKNRLEYENTVLRAALSPEMLAKLLPPASAPPSSAILKPAPPSQSSS